MGDDSNAESMFQGSGQIRATSMAQKDGCLAHASMAIRNTIISWEIFDVDDGPEDNSDDDDSDSLDRWWKDEGGDRVTGGTMAVEFGMKPDDISHSACAGIDACAMSGALALECREAGVDDDSGDDDDGRPASEAGGSRGSPQELVGWSRGTGGVRSYLGLLSSPLKVVPSGGGDGLSDLDGTVVAWLRGMMVLELYDALMFISAGGKRNETNLFQSSLELLGMDLYLQRAWADCLNRDSM